MAIIEVGIYIHKRCLSIACEFADDNYGYSAQSDVEGGRDVVGECPADGAKIIGFLESE